MIMSFSNLKQSLLALKKIYKEHLGEGLTVWTLRQTGHTVMTSRMKLKPHTASELNQQLCNTVSTNTKQRLLPFESHFHPRPINKELKICVNLLNP